MRADLRRRLEMAVRVRDFLRTHRTDGATEEGAALRLEQLVQRAEVLASQQRAGVIATRGSTERRAEVRRTLQSKLLRYLSAVGAVAARENVELGAQFRIQHPRGSNQAFLTMVRGMLDKATAQKEVLLARGLSAKLLDDLAAVLSEFEQTLEATRAARRDHVGASADLRAVLSEISQQVRVLDGLVRYRFGDNAEVMGAWASAHNVVGPFRSQKDCRLCVCSVTHSIRHSLAAFAHWGEAAPDALSIQSDSTDSLTVNITGKFNVKPNKVCVWNAAVTGGTGSYSFTWRKNGVVVGSSQSLTMNTGLPRSGSRSAW